MSSARKSWKGKKERWGRVRIISSHSKELQVPAQLVIEGVGGLEILPVLFTEGADVIGGHGITAEVGHGLELAVESLLSGFGWRDGGHSRDGWEELRSHEPCL